MISYKFYPFHRIDERQKIEDSYLYSDVLLAPVNGYEKANEIYRNAIDMGIKEGREKNKLLIEAHDKEMELFEQQLYSGGRLL